MKVNRGVLHRTTGLAGDDELDHHVPDLTKAFSGILPEVATAARVPACWLHSFDTESEKLALIGSCGATPKLLLEGVGFRAYSMVAMEAAANGRPLLIEDSAPHRHPYGVVLRQAGYHSLIIIPLQSDETTIGFLGADSSATRLTPQPAALLEAFAKLMAIGLSSTIAYSRIRHFTSFILHEIKTPLTPIVGSSELLAEELRASPLASASELVSNILGGARRLEATVSDLLDLSAATAGALKLEWQTVDLARLLQDVAQEYRPVVLRKDQSLALEVPASLPAVSGDRRRLEQIVSNLISNATKFAPRGGQITVRARYGSTEEVVEVEDNGPGIPLEEQRRLFHPYARGEADRQRFPGVGLGLALSHYLVQLHGGRMWLKSVVGKGSIFAFSLPLESRK